jgi:hypothetical protein
MRKQKRDLGKSVKKEKRRLERADGAQVGQK